MTEANPEAVVPIDPPGQAAGEGPACARMPETRVGRCPDCNAIWFMGVKLTEPAARLGVGLAIGGMVVGLLIAVLVSLTVLGPTLAAGADPTGTPVPTPTGASSTVSPVAAAALSGTAVVNQRMTADAASLAATLHRSRPRPADIATDLRAIAADAAQGSDLVARAGTWTDARPLTTMLGDYYRLVADKARAALQLSLNDQRAYRRAGRAVVRTLKRLDAIDAQVRTLAETAGIVLPSSVAGG